MTKLIFITYKLLLLLVVVGPLILIVQQNQAYLDQVVSFTLSLPSPFDTNLKTPEWSLKIYGSILFLLGVCLVLLLSIPRRIQHYRRIKTYKSLVSNKNNQLKNLKENHTKLKQRMVLMERDSDFPIDNRTVANNQKQPS